MSGAEEASLKLREAAKAAYAATVASGGAFARAHGQLQKDSDLVEVMRDVVPMIVAVADLHDAAENLDLVA